MKKNKQIRNKKIGVAFPARESNDKEALSVSEQRPGQGTWREAVGRERHDVQVQRELTSVARKPLSSPPLYPVPSGSWPVLCCPLVPTSLGILGEENTVRRVDRSAWPCDLGGITEHRGHMGKGSFFHVKSDENSFILGAGGGHRNGNEQRIKRRRVSAGLHKMYTFIENSYFPTPPESFLVVELSGLWDRFTSLLGIFHRHR